MEENSSKSGFRVEFDDDSVYLMDGSAELVMWTMAEWVEDPAVVPAMINAVVRGFTQGSAAVMQSGGE